MHKKTAKMNEEVQGKANNIVWCEQTYSLQLGLRPLKKQTLAIVYYVYIYTILLLANNLNFNYRDDGWVNSRPHK